jgi:predicted flap endonuclease-1-like 5' DNA nuclease
MSLGNLGTETLLLMMAGFLIGLVPALVFVGFYFGRQVEKQRRDLQLKYERQVTVLRETVRRLMNRIDVLTNERNQIKRNNTALREALRDQHEVTDRASQELEQTRQNLLRLQNQADDLMVEKQRYEGRLEQAELDRERMAAQFQQTVAQFTEVERLRSNLVFAAGKVREVQTENHALEARFARGLEPIPAEQAAVSADLLDVSLIGGIEPQYVERLHDSGIHTIGDLAKQTPARVAHFAGLQTWDDSAAWIAEAKARLATSNRAQA